MEIEELLEAVRDIQMTDEDIAQQRVSFVFGNLNIDNERITRKMVEEADRKLHPEDYPIGPMEDESFMVKVNGVAFRCICGANVFCREKGTEFYQCNACNQWYEGS